MKAKQLFKAFFSWMVLVILWPTTSYANYWGRVSLKVGEEKTLNLSSSTESLLSRVSVTSWSWTSANSSCVRVVSQSKDACVVRGVSIGEADVTFKCYYLADYLPENMTHYYTVYVTADPESISLPVSKTLTIQETVTLEPTVTPNGATSTLTWSSSDTSIATVSSTGDVTGISAGTAVITVTTQNGLSATCKVTIEDTVLPDPSSSWQKAGNYDISWFTNNQTEYTISTNKQLAGMAYIITNGYSDFKGTTIYLANDIDLGSNYWLAANGSFRGTFDGQGHTISNFYPKEYDGIKEENYVGLFGYAEGGAIKNLTVKGKINIEKTDKGTKTYIGGIIGYASNVDIDHCKSLIDISYSYLKKKNNRCELYIGGIVGLASGKIHHCSHVGSIYVSAEEEGYGYILHTTCIGGLAGECHSTIEYCENISSELSYFQPVRTIYYQYVYCGGLVGSSGFSASSSSASSITIKYSRSIVNNFSFHDKTYDTFWDIVIGGIAGRAAGSFINCYSIFNMINIDYDNEKDDIDWGDIDAYKLEESKANYSNSDVIIDSNQEINKLYSGSLAFTAEQMKTSSFLDELNMYSLMETGKGVWTQGEDGYPVIAELSPSPNTHVSSISLNESEATLSIGGTLQLTATVLPEDATDKSVTWSSSNESVATVSSNGLVTAKGEGEATITCTAGDGSGVTATCEVTVQPSTIYVSSITLNATEKNLMIDDDPFQLVATILPSNATNKSVTWTSSDEAVAKVDAEGLVTPVDVGDAIITCKANDGSEKSASCKIHIAMTYADIRFVSVVCDNKNLDRLTQDDKLAFHATFKNEGEADWIYSMIAICDKEMTQIIASGEEDLQVYPAGEEIKIDYEYGLDTIPAGNYYATVFYYNWNSGFWIYESPYLYEITVSDKPGTNKSGDVNGDGQVNGTDLVALTNIILGRNTKTSGADVNGDGQVNGTDYVALTNIILGKSKAPKRMVATVPKTVPEALQKRLKGINLMQQPIKKLER